MLNVKTDSSRVANPESDCPYKGNAVCTASLSSMAIDAYQTERWCGTDDYDACPIFLAKVLRKR
ncbi:MAG: hypothetical protein AB1442_16920 [Nitrospirota bacterium]